MPKNRIQRGGSDVKFEAQTSKLTYCPLSDARGSKSRPETTAHSSYPFVKS